ncbi:MAG: prepilin-type N-terminal cleavage/methylation domain-containing protein [Candidatus Omnitrophota bacterium]
MNKKGFTLIEVLIVVVIVAILAAMVLPRFISQPEKAILAEATQLLGALKRAQIQTMDMEVATAWQAISNVTNENDMKKIGMKAVADSKFFTYSCSATDNTCTAIRKSDTGSTITVSGTTATLTCKGKYVADSTTGGCKYNG